MAPPSPRRSSRARIPSSYIHGSSSNNGLTHSNFASGRPERSTRSNRPTSAKSTPGGSLSSEPPDDYDESHIARGSRRRGLEEDFSQIAPRGRLSRNDNSNMGNQNNDEIHEEDEAVRCVCGFDEYPGPPPVEHFPSSGTARRSREKDQDAEYLNKLEVSEDVSGFYVQCDICKVWQHGACVGIMSEESSPDEYYCEQCRKDLHKIHVASNGQRYSHYTIATRVSRATSRAASSAKEREREKEAGTGGRSGRASTASQTAKRRSTMNSRDAAYDEEEELRRAIEASKEDAPPEANEATTRRPKRGRCDSEENSSTSAKRQRTSSSSISPSLDQADHSMDESEDSSSTRNTKRSRQSGRNQQENSGRAEKERLRLEAVNKRKVRADRRRADGSASRGSEKDDGTAETQEMALEPTEVEAKPAEEEKLATTADVASMGAEAFNKEKSEETKVDEVRVEEAKLEDIQTKDVAQEAEKPKDVVPADNSAATSHKSIASKAAPVATALIEVSPATEEAPDTPPQATTLATAASTRKTTKTNKKGRGRNQYTRDRDEIEDSPARSTRESRHKTFTPFDGYSNGTHTRQSRHDHKNGNSHNSNHGSHKGKYNSGKFSIHDLKRRSAAYLDFIQKTQLELAAEATPSQSNSDISDPNSRETSHGPTGDKPSVVLRTGTPEPSTDKKEFGDLTCGEMMDALTRDLLKWQSQYLS